MEPTFATAANAQWDLRALNRSHPSQQLMTCPHSLHPSLPELRCLQGILQDLSVLSI